MIAPNANPSPRNSKVSVEVQKTPASITVEAVDHLAGWKLSFSQGPVSLVDDAKLTLASVLGGISIFLAGISGVPEAPQTGNITDYIEAVAEELGLAALAPVADPPVSEALVAAQDRIAALEADLAAAKAALDVPPVPAPAPVVPAEDGEESQG